MAGLRSFVVVGLAGIFGCTKPGAPPAEGKPVEREVEVKAPTAQPAAESKTPAKAITDAKTETKAITDAKAEIKAVADTKADAKVDDAKADPEPKGRLPGPPSPDLAVVGTSAGVVAMDGTGKTVGTLVDAKTQWCRVDPRAGVLWFRKEGSEALELLDLEDGGPAVTVIGKTPETIVIAHGEDRLGQPDSHRYQEGLLVHVAAPPRVEAILGCDGDMMWYCYDDDVEDYAVAEAELLAKNAKALAAEPFVGAEALAKLAERSAGRSAASAPERSPQPKRVKSVPRDHCEEMPRDCGKARRLTGSALWLVVVGNSRGDFFHEEVQVYDPKAKVFVDLTDPTNTSPQPLKDFEEFVPAWVSPSGELLMDHDSLVKVGKGTVAKNLSGVCGFWGGGWEIELDT